MHRCLTACAVALISVMSPAGPSLAQSTAAQSANPPAFKSTDTRTEADYALAAILRQMRDERRNSADRLAERELTYQRKLDAAQVRLQNTRERLAATEAQGARLEQRFDRNKIELNHKARLLKDKIGALKELFGVFQQNASDLIGAFASSPTSLQYPDRDIWLEAFANRMKHASEVTSADDIKSLWYEMMREIIARGEIVRVTGPVYDAADRPQQRKLIRIGGFHLLSTQPQAEYVQWQTGSQRVETMPRQPQGPYPTQIRHYDQAGSGPQTLSLDPTGGVLLSLLADKPSTQERVDQGGLVGYMILALGALAFLLALLKLLDIAVISWRVAAQRRRLDQPAKDNSLGRLLKVYQDNRHADAETLALRLHDRLSKESARIQRFSVFLGIIASVAPLMGLLGTVVGMINTFQAITLYGTGDPQTMAGGISQALITTVLGLVVAVPAVLLNAVVSARAKAVIQVLRQQMALLLGESLEQQFRNRSRRRPPLAPLPLAPQLAPQTDAGGQA